MPLIDRPLPWWQTAGLHTYTHPLPVFPPYVDGVVPGWAVAETVGVCLYRPDTGEWWWLATYPDGRPVRCHREHTPIGPCPCPACYVHGCAPCIGLGCSHHRRHGTLVPPFILTTG